MALPAAVESLDKLPEEARGHYEARNGGFVLRLEGEHPDYVPPTKLAEFRENNIKLRAELERFAGLDPEQARQALADRKDAADKKLLAQGKFDELMARERAEAAERAAELTKALEAEKARRAELEAERATRTIEDVLRDRMLAPQRNIKPTCFSIFKKLAQVGDDGGVRWTLDERGAPHAVKADGVSAYSPTDPTKPLSIDEWLDGIVKAHPEFQVLSSGGGATGSTAGGGTLAAELAQLSPAERVKAWRRGAAA